MLSAEEYMEAYKADMKKRMKEYRRERRSEFWQTLGALLCAIAATVPISFVLACLAVMAVG